MDIDIDGWKVAEVLSAAFTGVLGWLGIRNINKIDELEKNSVPRPELVTLLAASAADRKEMHNENKAYLQRIEGKIDTAKLDVMRSDLDTLTREVNRLREWRHTKADPYIKDMERLDAEGKRLHERVGYLERRGGERPA